jgi:hypothetical protein
MLKTTFQFDFSDLKLNITLIEKVMGYKDGESHETISQLVGKVLKEAVSGQSTVFSRSLDSTKLRNQLK